MKEWPKHSATIYHAGGWNHNWGDRVIQYAVRQHMERMAHPHELLWRYIDYQNEAFGAELIDEINNCADVLVIGPGGAIMNREHGPLQVQIDPHDWDRIKVPIAVLSIGVNEFPYRDRVNTRHPSIVALVARAEQFSVRNHGSRQAMHLSKRAVPVIADAGFMIEPEPIDMDLADINIALCYAYDRPEKRWQGEQAERRFKQALWGTLNDLAIQPGARVWEIEHINGDNACLEDAGKFAGQYKHMDLVLGMRKHSVMIPYGQYVPTIGLGDQAEVRWFLEDMGEERYLATSENIDELPLLIDRILDERKSWQGRVSVKKRIQKQEFWGALWNILKLAGVVVERTGKWTQSS